MSLYRFIASDYQLLEVDHSGFIEMTVRDMKKMNPLPASPAIFQSWNEIDEDATILYAENESDLGGLRISLCDNPPYDLEHYIGKRYVYWLEGDFGTEFLDQLIEYVRTNVKAENGIELWSIWFGDGIKPVQVENVNMNEFCNLHSRNL